MSSFKNKTSTNTKRGFIRSSYSPKLSIHTFFWPFMDRLAFPAAIRFPPGIKTKPVSHQGRSWLVPGGRLPSRFCLQEDQQVVYRPLHRLLSHTSLEIQNGQSCLQGKCSCHLLPLLAQWLVRWCWMLYHLPFILFSFAVIWEREAYTVLLGSPSSWRSC